MGLSSIASGMLGLALGTENREAAKTAIHDGIDLLFITPDAPPVLPPATPTPALAQ